MVTREEALALFLEHNKSDSLLKHALAVEAALRAYARHFGEDEQKWGITGLLHDLDYEEHPTAEEHPAVGAQMLEDLGFPEDMVYAVRAHGDRMGLERKSRLDKSLYAVDELTGFIIAVALVRPSKNVADVDFSSVKKKMKDKAFARAIDRDQMVRGAEALSVSFEEHVNIVIAAMQGIAADLGIDGA